MFAAKELDRDGGMRGGGVEEFDGGRVDGFGRGEGAANDFDGAGGIGAFGGDSGGIEKDGGTVKEPLVGVGYGVKVVVGEPLADYKADKPECERRVNRESTVHSKSLYK